MGDLLICDETPCVLNAQFVALSDTVGFISDLPVQLVDAFRATLEEVVEADVLLHVLDASIPNVHEQREAVIQVQRQWKQVFHFQLALSSPSCSKWPCSFLSECLLYLAVL